MGNGSVIRAGEVQRMTAGTGVFHSEFNPSESEAARLLQIWIMPDRGGHTPGYEQIMIPEPDKRGRLRLIASSDGREGSVTINQALDLYAALLDGDETIDFDIGLRQKAWLQLARGSVRLNGMKLQPGDGVAVEDEPVLSLSGGKRAEVLLFVMPRTA